MSRWMLLTVVAILACASTPETVPLVGTSRDLSGLVGEWSGEYDGGSTGRSGSIVFVLRSAADTARSRAALAASKPGDGGLRGSERVAQRPWSRWS